jgi:hypothetical protein
MKARAFFLIIFLILLSGLIAGCGQQETPPPTATATEFSRMEITTATPITPTATNTETPTETPTITNTPEPATETPTITPTFDPQVSSSPTQSAKPQISPKSDTNCRKQPDKESKVIGFFVKGQVFEILAKDKYAVWFLIPNPTVAGDPNCWVWAGNTEVNGDLNSVPVFTMK